MADKKDTFASNYIHDLGKYWGEVAQSVTHPKETVKGLSNAYLGVLARAGIEPTGEVGPGGEMLVRRINRGTQTPEQRQETDTQIGTARAAFHALADKWGLNHDPQKGGLRDTKSWSWDPNVALQSLRTQPVHMFSDMAMPLSLVSGGAGALAEIPALSSVAPALNVASKAAKIAEKVTNPAAVPMAALTGSGKAFPIIPRILTTAQAALLPNSARTMLQTYKMGKASSGAPKVNGETPSQAFMNAASGGDQAVRDIQKAAIDSIEQDKVNAIAAHKVNKAGLGQAPINFKPIMAALSEAEADLNKSAEAAHPTARAAIDKVRAIVEDHITNPDPNFRTVQGADRMRHGIGGIQTEGDSGPAVLSSGNPDSFSKGLVGDIYHAVRSEIGNTDPAYTQIMNEFNENQNLLRNLEGITSTPSELTRNLESLTDPQGQPYLNVLSKKDPLMPWRLMGLHFQEFTGPKTLTAGILAKAPSVKAPLVTATSPRFSGLMNFNAGKIAGALEGPAKVVGAGMRAATSPEAIAGYNVATAANSGSQELTPEQVMSAPENSTPSAPITLDPRGMEERKSDEASAPEPTEYTPAELQKLLNPTAEGLSNGSPFSAPPDAQAVPAAKFAGGRVGRATGGGVHNAPKHEYLVNRLLKMAKDAKKVSDRTTEPLLKMPDEHIVRALDVAQQAI
jgi:hypothetical protein